MEYVILVENDGTLYGSQKCRIMQREKLFNKLYFLVAPDYNGYDMSQCVVTMRYLLPISKEFKTETLVLAKDRYNCYLKYVLPVDTNLTKEWGDIELNLTFIMLDIDDNGNAIQRVRKTENHILHITKLPDWDSIIPDSALSALDQRIIAQTAQIKMLEDIVDVIDSNKVDNLVYNDDEETLQLSANGNPIGDKVSVREMLDDGIPVVDLNGSGSDDKPNDDSGNGCNCDCEDNVVEFGNVITPEKPDEDDDNVVEF